MEVQVIQETQVAVAKDYVLILVERQHGMAAAAAAAVATTTQILVADLVESAVAVLAVLAVLDQFLVLVVLQIQVAAEEVLAKALAETM